MHDKSLLIVICFNNYPKLIILHEMLNNFLIFIPHATQINHFVAFLLIILYTMYCSYNFFFEFTLHITE